MNKTTVKTPDSIDSTINQYACMTPIGVVTYRVEAGSNKEGNLQYVALKHVFTGPYNTPIAIDSVDQKSPFIQSLFTDTMQDYLDWFLWANYEKVNQDEDYKSQVSAQELEYRTSGYATL